MDNKKYAPVSCEFVDHIEIAATNREMVEIVYKQNGKVITFKDRIITWQTIKKEEFLVTENNTVIRLYKIISLNGLELNSFC